MLVRVILCLAAAPLCASAVRDVPRGYCHQCEVTCFEDCTAKYDREIIIPDMMGTDRHSREDTRVEAEMKKTLYGVVLSQNSTSPGSGARPANATALTDTFSSCLAEAKCPCPVEEKRKQATSFLAVASGKKRCAVGERPCAVGCLAQTVSAPAAFVQRSAVAPGPSDADDAAIPWSINVHPVKINTFSTGRLNLDRCFKSCLAATCGCDDAPGMNTIEDMHEAIRINDQAKDPVEDTPPAWQYRHAPIEECGKGMQGKKIVKGLYADLAGGPEGWVEVCSDEFFGAMGTAPDVGKINCDNDRALMAGCVWDDVQNECVYGLKKRVRCYQRYLDDDKL